MLDGTIPSGRRRVGLGRRRRRVRHTIFLYKKIRPSLRFLKNMQKKGRYFLRFLTISIKNPAWLSEARGVTIHRKEVKKRRLFCDRRTDPHKPRCFSPQKIIKKYSKTLQLVVYRMSCTLVVGAIISDLSSENDNVWKNLTLRFFSTFFFLNLSSDDILVEEDRWMMASQMVPSQINAFWIQIMETQTDSDDESMLDNKCLDLCHPDHPSCSWWCVEIMRSCKTLSW